MRGLYAKSQAGKPVYLKEFKYERHISGKTLVADPRLPVICAYDFGRTPAAVFLQQRPDGRLLILREAVGFDMGLKTHLTTLAKPIINNFFRGNPLIFTGDPSGERQADSDDNSCFKELKTQFSRDKGYTIKACHTNDPIVRINALGEALRQWPDGEPLVLIDPSCKWLIEGARSKYRYQRRQGNFEMYQDKPEKNNWSHVMEAAQYGVLFLDTRYRAADYARISRSTPPIRHRPADSYAGY
jgi:hypothetical protein